MRVLLVEDDKNLSEALSIILKKQKYTVDAVYNGEDGLYYALSKIYDVVILDIMLPIMDGISVLKRLRAEGNDTPVLVLTAKSATLDKVAGLDCGADDYLAKPFETTELLARIRALARRRIGTANSCIMQIGNVRYNISALTLSNDKQTFTLTLKESGVFEILAQNKNMVVSKNSIIEKVWGYESEAEDSHVEFYISFLRKKLTALNASCEIHTLRGAGYTLKTQNGD